MNRYLTFILLSLLSFVVFNSKPLQMMGSNPDARCITAGINENQSSSNNYVRKPLYLEHLNAFALFDNNLMDFGDAPDSYATLLASNGAGHLIVAGLFLGNTIDDESDGQPTSLADGDDLNNIDDEDGVDFPWPLTKGTPNVASVMTSVGGGFLNAWIDFNADGDWNEANEQVVLNQFLHPGNNVLGFVIPVNAVTGNTYARFRYSTLQGLAPFGLAPDGEVEDYLVNITTSGEGIKWEQQLDPSNSGFHSHDYIQNSILKEENVADDWVCPGGLVTAIHWWGNYEINNGVELRGSGIDHFIIAIYSETVGCAPGTVPLATFTVPLANVNETGIGITTPGGSMIYKYVYFLSAPFNQVTGNRYWISITAHAASPLYPAQWRWNESLRIDLPFLCPAKGRTVSAGIPGLWNDLSPGGNLLANMAFSLTNSGPFPLDYGDAPDTYATLLASNGPRHDTIAPGVVMGILKDTELNGQPTSEASGDDASNLDDEDGVIFLTPLVHGQNASLSVTSSLQGALFNGWMDFNGDGDFLDANEKVVSNFQTNTGANTVSFMVPVNAIADSTYCRFRISTVVNLSSTGYAPNGEVEDYRVIIYDETTNFDWGDAPDPTYPTVFVSNGARHIISSLYMGNFVDAELNGQPNATASGDDNTVIDDEDGVVFNDILKPGQNAGITITASQNGGYLNAWVDFNRDGDWNDTAEQVFTDTLLSSGVNNLVFVVPQNSSLGKTYLRFRLSTAQGVSFTGLAPDGEVEDYYNYIVDPGESKMHWPQLPDTSTSGTGTDIDLGIRPAADDFLCTETGAINHFRIWGSFAGDHLPPQGAGGDTLQLLIHSDIPVQGEVTYSRPGVVLWSRTFYPGTYSASLLAGSVSELWYNPAMQQWQANLSDSTFQFDFPVPDNPFIQTQGTIYWLEVKYIHSSSTSNGIFGWKSTPQSQQWNDAAVWYNPNNFSFPIGWVPINYPAGHPHQGQAVGLSFVIFHTPPLSEIKGHVYYDNQALSPMASTTVLLYSGDTLISGTLTNQEGYYHFTGLAPGSYHLGGNTTQTWGGVNSADAMIIMQHFVHYLTLTGFRAQAADVTGSSGINALDALTVARRFVGLIPGFPVGDWLFETPTIIIPFSGSYTKDFKAICYGDVNGSNENLEKKSP
jgi:hypothetical protein